VVVQGSTQPFESLAEHQFNKLGTKDGKPGSICDLLAWLAHDNQSEDNQSKSNRSKSNQSEDDVRVYGMQLVALPAWTFMFI
jgi:hypothetical protein